MKKEEKYFNDGLDAYNNKDYKKAIDCFNEIINKFSNSIGNAKLSEIYYMRGICYAQEYSIDEALEDFNEAEKLGFDKSKIYCGRGIAYAHIGENNKAIANFYKAIKLNNVYEEAYCRIGIAYTFMEEYDKAITYFNKAVELNKSYYEAYHYRGFVFYQKKEYGKAIEDFDKAIELDNKSILDYNYRGLIYYGLKEYDKAIEDFNTAIELDDEFVLAYNNRGMIYLNRNEKDEYGKAIKDFNKAIELDNKFALAYGNRGLVYYKLKKYDKAIEDFNKAIELDNEFALAYNNRGIIYLNRNEKDEYGKAIKDFNKAIELDNKFALAYGNRGLVYYKLKKYDKAIEDFNKAVKLDAEFIQVYNNIGLAYFYKGEYDKAFKNFKKFNPNKALNYMIKLFIINKKNINNIENLPIKYSDSYFTSVIGKNIKINKNKLFKIWCYQYVLLDLLSIKNYQNIKEFSHYTSKNIFDILISNDVENNECLRFTSISKANDPKEGEILKNLLSINTEKNIDIKEQNKDYLVLQTSFIRYTNSLTMFRLYGKDKEREGTGISLVFNNTFFDINELTTTSPAQSLGNPTNYDYEKENNIETNKNYKKLQLPYSKIYSSIELKDELLPLYFILYYDVKNNELIYNPTDSIYKNEVINLKNLFDEDIEYDKNNINITNNIKFMLKNIFIIIRDLKNEELELAYKLLINIRYLIKHSSFFEEQELRLIQLTKNDSNDVSFDKNINRLYSDYKVSIFEENYLKKIIIGPKVENASSVKEVYQYLITKNKINKNIDIEISDLPLN